MRQIDELEALREMRDLLLPPQNWVQGVYALADRTVADPDRLSLFGQDERATCWCLIGATQRIHQGRSVTWTPAYQRILKLALAKGYGSIPSFNDSSNHVKVLA